MIFLLEEQHDLPLCDVRFVVRTGASADPNGREGLARYAAELMRRGAAQRRRAELDTAIDALGASLEVEARQDFITWSGHCLRRNLEGLLALAGDVLCRPRFDEDEEEKLRRESLALLDDIRDDDGSLAARFFEREALAGHAYGRSVLGDERSIGLHDAAQAAAWARAHVVKDNLIVGVAGDVDEATARALVEDALASLPAGPAPAPVALPPPPLPQRRR